MHIPKTGGTSISRMLQKQIPQGFYIRGAAHHMRHPDCYQEFLDLPTFAIDRDCVEVARSAYSHACSWWEEKGRYQKPNRHHWYVYARRTYMSQTLDLSTLAPKGYSLWDWYCGPQVRRYQYQENMDPVWKQICDDFDLPYDSLDTVGIVRNPEHVLKIRAQDIREHFGE